MSEIAISARNLTKRYRLYRKPLHRFLDTYGMLWGGPKKYVEHAAVNGINFDVSRGEKVAIIGRNGAGKSTLLKMLCGVISPTSGEIQVNGEIHALLSLGAGFHPDFTGRENVYSHLAHLGISGPAADQAFAEIVDFAELHEYINQPVKTYSAGMSVRLMFSTSTVITPDILVIDEVLGAGDAYFSRKSFERMQELCEGAGTTLVMVTHDLYSAVKFCERLIWVDRGVIKMDGPGKVVLRAYEESIREQEEQRLRQRRLAAVKANLDETGEVTRLFPGFLRVTAANDEQVDFAVSGMRFFAGERQIANIEMTGGQRSARAMLVLDEKEGNWGDVETIDDRAARRMRSFGSIFHKLPIILNVPDLLEAISAGEVRAEVDCRAGRACSLELAILDEHGNRLGSGHGLVPADEWIGCQLAIAALPGQGAAASGPMRHGHRAMEITDVQFLDAQGDERFQYGAGATLRIRLAYRLNKPDFHEKPTIVAAFQQNGLVRSHRLWTDQVFISAEAGLEGAIEVVASPLLLGAGTYLVTISVFHEGYLRSSGPKKFFTASDQIHDMHVRAYEIVIRPSPDEPFCNDVIFQHPSIWLVNGASVVESVPHVDPDEARIISATSRSSLTDQIGPMQARADRRPRFSGDTGAWIAQSRVSDVGNWKERDGPVELFCAPEDSDEDDPVGRR